MNAESLKLELLERVLLNMNYNTSLTSEENKKNIFEQKPDNLMPFQSDYGLAGTVGVNYSANKLVKNAQKQSDARKTIVDNTIKFFKEGSFDKFMEKIREFLLSDAGLAISVFVSITGIGAIAGVVVWAIMAIYDIYKYFNTNNMSYLVNLLIDILSMFTGGVAGKALGKITAPAIKTMEQFFEWLIKSKLVLKISPYLTKIGSALTQELEYLTIAKDMLVKKLNLKFLETGFSKLITYLKQVHYYLKIMIKNNFKSISLKRSTQVLTYKILQSNLAKSVLKRIPKLSNVILKYVKSLSPGRIALGLGKTVEEGQWKALVSWAETNLRDKPTIEVLKAIDRKFGTEWAEKYAFALNSYKYGKQMTTTGPMKGVDFIKNTLQGKDILDNRVDPLRNMQKIGPKIGQ